MNPADPRRIPGGSSSGSAVAVATGEADVALGTDTGGSVRIPAACCGVVGLKTTWGRVPVDGVYPLAPSLDTVGPLGADVSAVELGMRLIEPGFAAGSCELAAGRLRAAADVDPAVDAAVDAALAAAGVLTTDVTGLDLGAAVRAADVLIDAEAYQANAHLMPQLDRLSPQMRRNLTEAAAVTDDEVAAANRTRQAVREWFSRTLARHPFLALPTLVGPPPLIGERGIPLTVLTMPANLAGLPALSLPVPGGPAGPARIPPAHRAARRRRAAHRPRPYHRGRHSGFPCLRPVPCLPFLAASLAAVTMRENGDLWSRRRGIADERAS